MKIRIHKRSCIGHILWAFALVAIALPPCLSQSVGIMRAQTNLSIPIGQTDKMGKGWQFHQISGPANQTLTAEQRSAWFPATVPGDIHLDLLANKLIPDPFFRDNYAKLQWIEDAAWEYRATFDISASQLSRGNLDLVFDGLDAACAVSLNGQTILNANNAFRIWRVPVKSHLHVGANTLLARFPSPIQAAKAAAASDPWQARIHIEDSAYIRKPAYEYGWDWGPRFVTSGIYRPIHLEIWDAARIADLHIRQRDVAATVAHLDAEVEVVAAKAGPARITLAWQAPAKGTAPASEQTLTQAVLLHPGSNTLTLPIEIRNPQLWYPNGYGSQPLYTFTSSLVIAGAAQDSRQAKTGLRSVVLRRDLDAWGRSFEFVVNGIPVFAKGADVIPFDSFPNRVTTAGYRRILEGARDANMNMIRHWGGGYYETDAFYQICDELGLMVWQDFMFGNHWNPGTYDFKQSIEAEAIDQVTRLRNHPSIVLWSGNNETEAAFTWEGRPGFPPDTRIQMWKDYLTEFSGILPRVVARLDPETPYWPSSPSNDYEPVSPKYESGDAHDWDILTGRHPYTDFEQHHWRFVSEYGFFGFPDPRTVDSYTLPPDRAGISTPAMLAHVENQNESSNKILRDYIAMDYPQPKDADSLMYVSQVLQAEYVKLAAEHFRRSRPETMGNLYWQLNDCWPVASFAGIDYYGRWKALQYYARRFYAPILVSPHIEDGAVKFYIVSDKTAPENAEMRLALMDFEGKILLEEDKPVAIAPLSSQVYAEWPLAKLTAAGATDTSRVMVVARLYGGPAPSGGVADRGAPVLSENLIYLAPTKQARLPEAHIEARLSETGQAGHYKLRIASPTLARSVAISFGTLDASLGDNYFDLLPGVAAEIAVGSKSSLADLRKNLQVRSLRDAFGDNGNAPAFSAP